MPAQPLATMTSKVSKQAIRQRMMLARERLPARLRAQYSAEIVRRILLTPEYRAARAVLGYMNFGTEFESDLLLRQALADGKQLFLPKVNRATRELDVYRVIDLEYDLAPGLWTIREPLPDRCTKMDALGQVDYVLLPGLAFWHDGSRLGYGGGYYDRLLARLKKRGGGKLPALVAASYSLQLAGDIPMEASDHPVQWVTTELQTIRCDAGL